MTTAPEASSRTSSCVPSKIAKLQCLCTRMFACMCLVRNYAYVWGCCCSWCRSLRLVPNSCMCCADLYQNVKTTWVVLVLTEIAPTAKNYYVMFQAKTNMLHAWYTEPQCDRRFPATATIAKGCPPPNPIAQAVMSTMIKLLQRLIGSGPPSWKGRLSNPSHSQ